MSEDTQPTRVYSTHSDHHDITVEDRDGVRVMRFGGRLQCAADVESLGESRTPAQDYLHLPLALAPHATRTLMIGLGGGVLARSFLRAYPQMRIDVVELDPEVVDVARRYFGLQDEERLRIIVDDGRHYLAQSGPTYDVVILDALFEAYTPFVFATCEYMAMLKRRLAPGGVYAHNAIGYLVGEESRTFRRYLRTLRDAFVTLHVFGVSPVYNQESGRRNYVLLASDDAVEPDELRSRVLDRAGDAARIDRFASFADDLLPPVADLDGFPPLADAEMPADGLMRS